MATEPTTSNDCYPETGENTQCTPATKSNALNAIRGEDRNGCEIAVDAKDKHIIAGDGKLWKARDGSKSERIFLDLEEVLSSGFALGKRSDGQIVAIKPPEGQDALLASLGGEVQFIDLTRGTNVFDKDILTTARTGFIPVLECDSNGDYVLKILDIANCDGLGTDDEAKIVCVGDQVGEAAPAADAVPYIHFASRREVLSQLNQTSSTSGTAALLDVPANASHVQITIKMVARSDYTGRQCRVAGLAQGIECVVGSAEDHWYGHSSSDEDVAYGSVLVPITDPGGANTIAWAASMATSQTGLDYDIFVYQDWFLITPV